VLPIIVVPALYLRIYVVVRRATVRVNTNSHAPKSQQSQQQPQPSQSRADASKSQATSQPPPSRNKHTRMAYVLFLTYLAFALTFLPFIVYSGVPVDPANVSVIRYVEGGVWMTVYVGLAANPVIYACLFADIRQAFKGAFRRSSRSNRVMHLAESFATNN
jgi:acetyl esterase/lipase